MMAGVGVESVNGAACRNALKVSSLARLIGEDSPMIVARSRLSCF